MLLGSSFLTNSFKNCKKRNKEISELQGFKGQETQWFSNRPLIFYFNLFVFCNSIKNRFPNDIVKYKLDKYIKITS